MNERKNKKVPSESNERAAGRPRILSVQCTVTYSMNPEDKAFIAAMGGSKFIRELVADYRKNALRKF